MQSQAEQRNSDFHISLSQRLMCPLIVCMLPCHEGQVWRASLILHHSLESGGGRFPNIWSLHNHAVCWWDDQLLVCIYISRAIRSSAQHSHQTSQSNRQDRKTLQGKDQNLFFSLQAPLGGVAAIIIPLIVLLSLCSLTVTMLKLALVLGCLLSIALALPVSVTL